MTSQNFILKSLKLIIIFAGGNALLTFAYSFFYDMKKSFQKIIPSTPLIEGIDYYIENGYWVFTSLYHQKRGHCCQSGCRHCPYGFRKNNNTSSNL